ncbi:DUF916 and DUF3324 domain-containing protein [Enterococcus dongliensis]|uniref:DUF916 and DUF3324 domain-containing protein n=1 Tax=Enterococcus dongliensis TaxID=2559925 RepID=A0AAW8TG44_9ENTE|nr:DUF916 and DUF3324 domain-containing protein [Enterococcus dongliensis]MDT2595667.1 DUF916 and DUF3324 domain-containing protein [Enterococcus dongliensis]MDT2633885.1 DUF916 and DUF3324 domain-containing protein [Enterococcus dongliensis]MDT2636279.1 DUF916 and DUF3324 domain-containing protein [Enterococcus dongliensis]MDT2641501.1 DUF916 and DUF3324 domain-containing protein [Enterococcus dongliensis]MDT2646833.1 DUF916 and DUF3324 domain-containing protein [Enterococcus dongliensis]
MNQRKRLFIALIAFLGILFVFPTSSHAADTPGDFGLKPVFPENQLDKAIGYFDLLVTPKQEQTIEVTLTNAADKERVFEVSVNPAVTSDGGTIDYGQEKPRLDKTLPFDIRKAITLNQTEYTVAAKSEITIPITLTIPAEPFVGRVLGGIHVIPKEEEEKKSAKETGVQIKNRIAYNLAIVLQEKQEPVNPDLKLLSGDLVAVNASPTVQLFFQNPQPTIISNLIFTSKIYYEDQLYIENTSNKFLVAPNSNFHLNLDLAGERAKPGNYRADIVAKSGEEHEWHFTQNFTIKKEEAQKVNNNSVFAVEEKSFPWIYIILGVIAVLLLIVLLVFLKRRKKEEPK